MVNRFTDKLSCSFCAIIFPRIYRRSWIPETNIDERLSVLYPDRSHT